MGCGGWEGGQDGRRPEAGRGRAAAGPSQRVQLGFLTSRGGHSSAHTNRRNQHWQRGVDTGRSAQNLHVQRLHVGFSPAHTNPAQSCGSEGPFGAAASFRMNLKPFPGSLVPDPAGNPGRWEPEPAGAQRVSPAGGGPEQENSPVSPARSGSRRTHPARSGTPRAQRGAGGGHSRDCPSSTRGRADAMDLDGRDTRWHPRSACEA